MKLFTPFSIPNVGMTALPERKNKLPLNVSSKVRNVPAKNGSISKIGTHFLTRPEFETNNSEASTEFENSFIATG